MADFKFPESRASKWANPTCNSAFSNKKAKQSPINIDTESLQECHTLCNLEINYKPNTCKIKKTKQNLYRINYSNGSYIKFNNFNYELKYIQFHTPAMHTVDFKTSEMEILLYHSNYDDKELLEEHQYDKSKKKFYDEKIHKKSGHSHVPSSVNEKTDRINGIIISILVNFDELNHRKSETLGTLPNQFISQFIKNGKISKNEMEIDVSKDWNVSMLLPKKKTFYMYDGSLPFPPCRENYKYIVFEEHINIIHSFVHLFRLNGNSKSTRQLHPLNNRLVFYNNNIEIKNKNTNIENKDEKTKTKNELVKNMLSPIRIQVKDVEGLLFSKKASEIESSYYNENKDYQTSEATAIRLSNKWDDAGKIGYEEINVGELNEMFTKSQNYEIFDNVVFDKNIDNYPELDAELQKILDTGKFEIVSKLLENKDLFKTIENKSDLTTKLQIDKNDAHLNDNDFLLLKNINKLSDSEGKINLVNLLVFDWYINISDKLINYFSSKGIKKNIMLRKIIENLENEFGMEDLMIKKYTHDLQQTISGEQCQNWGSNEIHYEGNIFNIFRPKIVINPSQEFTWDEIGTHKHSYYLKKMIRDGLFKYNPSTKKWKTHNSCRNPNSSNYASWCYTKNPKKRWEYCVEPHYDIQMRKYILIFLFLFIIFLSYFMVKLIFRNELFTQFMSRLTGTKFEPGGEGSSPTANTSPESTPPS